MIAVEVGDADPGDLVRGDAGEQHLPLRALARVEQQPLVVPAQEVPVVIARAGGCLTCGTEDDQLTVGHGLTLAAPKVSAGSAIPPAAAVEPVRRAQFWSLTQSPARSPRGVAESHGCGLQPVALGHELSGRL